MANVAGGLAPSARLLQKLHLISVQYARDFIESDQHFYPEIADDAMSIYTRCSMPTYRPNPTKPVPDDGYPRNPHQKMKIPESLRCDIAQRKVSTCSTTALIYGERSEYTPTATAPKRIPDRTPIDKIRTISDLRGANLGIDAAEFPHLVTGSEGHRRKDSEKTNAVPRRSDKGVQTRQQ